MKRLFLLILPLLALTFNACSSSNNDDEPNYGQLIVGTWQATHLNGVTWPYESTTYTYNADKTYSASGYFNHTGTYTLLGRTLTFTYVDGESYTYTAEIKSVNAKEATIVTDWGDGQLQTMRLKKL